MPPICVGDSSSWNPVTKKKKPGQLCQHWSCGLLVWCYLRPFVPALDLCLRVLSCSHSSRQAKRICGSLVDVAALVSMCMYVCFVIQLPANGVTFPETRCRYLSLSNFNIWPENMIGLFGGWRLSEGKVAIPVGNCYDCVCMGGLKFHFHVTDPK